MSSDFIDSVINGIIPSNLIFNKEFMDGAIRMTCIDGKQRIISLRKFYSNQLPYIINGIDPNDSEENKITHIYFSELPKKKDKTISYKVLNKIEQFMYFLDRKIPVAYYSNLDYDRQVDVFFRINKMKIATPGEIILSHFKNQNVTVKFKQFTDRLNFLKQNSECDQTRGSHIDYILNPMYMIHHDDTKTLNSQKRKDEFINYLDDENNFDELIDECESPLKVFYSKNIYNSNIVKKLGMRKHFTVVMCYLVHKHYKLEESNSEIYEQIRAIIVRVWSGWNKKANTLKTNTSDKASKRIEKYFDEIYSLYTTPGDSDIDPEYTDADS